MPLNVNRELVTVFYLQALIKLLIVKIVKQQKFDLARKNKAFSDSRF